ncbi:DegV family protein [Pygmaiobacter massiliensis]|uniref:DegV family protein n=1 Tax=Pygmaiobacter massiliensis TaxID=1917873 RepID=UPI0028A1719F|nr:DegV family protein [Pygmaiobacter massiliensis]
MKNYILSCESTVDLTREHLAQRGIAHIGYPFELGGKCYLDDFWNSISYEEFYCAMSRGAESKTAQINAYEFELYFEPFLKDGKDILHLCLSSGITGVMNSALIAKEHLEKKYPERKIYIVDSLAASSGSGLLMDRLADLRDEGMDILSLYEWVEQNKLCLHHWFFSTDLSFYIRGGRISKSVGLVSGILGICPLLNVNDEGRLIPREKIRGKKNVMKAIVHKMELYAKNGHNYTDKCYISHSACLDDAKQVAATVENTFPNLCGKVETYDIGTIIGSHTGPGTVALFFWGEPRKK